jgi:hypothetical protein
MIVNKLGFDFDQVADSCSAYIHKAVLTYAPTAYMYALLHVSKT